MPEIFADLILVSLFELPGFEEVVGEIRRRKEEGCFIPYELPCVKRYLDETYCFIMHP